MASIAEESSLFEIDMDPDGLLEEMEYQVARAEEQPGLGSNYRRGGSAEVLLQD